MVIFKEEEGEIEESEEGILEENLGLGFRQRRLGGERGKVGVPQLQLMVKLK